jgi:hypothetical protein
MHKIYMGMALDGKSVEVSLLHGTDTGKHNVRTVRELIGAISEIAHKNGADPGALVDDGFMASSSMDFPEEYTDDPELLAFVEEIMGN